MTGSRTALHSVPDWRGWGPVALESALWLVLAFTGARLAWLLLVSPTPSEPAPMPHVAIAPVAYPAGDPFYPDDSLGIGATSAPLEGFTLHGVRNAGGELGAIIADGSGRQRAFRVGDNVAAGVVLQGVGPGHAVLVAGGARHRLALPATGDAQAMGTAPAAAMVRTRPAPAPAPTTAPTTGLRVEDHPALRLAGLEPGDVLLAVDGRPPSPEWLATMAHDGARSGATLRVLRGDRTLTLVVGPVLR